MLLCEGSKMAPTNQLTCRRTLARCEGIQWAGFYQEFIRGGDFGNMHVRVHIAPPIDVFLPWKYTTPIKDPTRKIMSLQLKRGKTFSFYKIYSILLNHSLETNK